MFGLGPCEPEELEKHGACWSMFGVPEELVLCSQSQFLGTENLREPNFGGSQFFAIYNCHFFYLFFDYLVECVSVSFSGFGLRRVAFTCFAMAARVLPRLPG